jgi:HPt (histidine-containing phosphotransfer) domain-containing protein
MSWSQFDLGSDFDVATLSVVATLDPTGANGVVEDVLRMFQASLEPLLVRLERHRATESMSDIRFEAHKLYSAAGQLGAVRLTRACNAVLDRFHEEGRRAPEIMDTEFDSLLIQLIGEIIRVQRKLAQLLQR